jgi:uncharacterized RDD family membrane protein YckC
MHGSVIGGRVLAFPPEFYLILAAILVASIVVSISIVVILVTQIRRPPDQELIASTPVRAGAFIIDFTAIIGIMGTLSVLSQLDFLDPSIIPYMIFSFFATLPIYLMSYMIYYNLYLFYLLIPSYSPVNPGFIVVVGFLYFALSESLSHGFTLGKKIFGIRSVSQEDYTPPSVRGVLLNALGKSFIFLWDIVFGVSRQIVQEDGVTLRQIRLTQRLSKVVVINTRYRQGMVQYTDPLSWSGYRDPGSVIDPRGDGTE